MNNRLIRAIIIAQAAIAVAAVSISAWMLLHPVIAPAPFSYDHEVAAPYQSNLCPGELLRWRIRATITRVPVVVQIYQSWWSIDRQRSMTPMPPVLNSIFTEAFHIDRDTAIPTPNDLVSDRYEYRVAAQESASGAKVLRVPFTIKENCDVPTKP